MRHLVACAALLGGCALAIVGPDYQARDLRLPNNWTAATSNVEAPAEHRRRLAQWWKQFGDETLNALNDLAFTSNLDLKLAQARLNQTQVSRQLADADLYPTVSASASRNRTKSADVISPQSTSTLFDAGFDATWEIDIMLVSVTERTRDIGIHLAIGALEHEVLLQFLIEAVVLSACGGLIGIALALLACIVLSALLEVPFLFNTTINLLAFLFSAAIGVIFGYMLARRATLLDPIQALRHK